MDLDEDYDLVTREKMKINGVNGASTFRLAEEGQAVGTCRTCRNPYDLIVATILMRAKMLAGNGFYLRFVKFLLGTILGV